MEPQPPRPRIAAPIDARHARSRVTNGASGTRRGSKLFAKAVADGRSGWSRRLRDLIALHVSDLGGENIVSTAEHSLCRRIAAITTELEWIERKFALSRNGPAAEDLDLYLRGSNSLRRLLEAIGLKRVARDVTPLLQDYLANHPAAVAEDDEPSP
jgi:hypothetical protein